MPEGMGLGMGGQTPWGRMLGQANNNFSTSMPMPSLGGLKPPGMQPTAAMQPKPVQQPMANVQGVQQALGKVAMFQNGAPSRGPGDAAGSIMEGLLASWGADFDRPMGVAKQAAAGLIGSGCTMLTGRPGYQSRDKSGTRAASRLPGSRSTAGKTSRPDKATKTGFDRCMEDSMDAIDALIEKTAAQDNSAPQRSETGGSHGLSYNHKDDDYAQGQAAWAATGKYFKGGSKLSTQPNPFIGKHRGKQAASMILPPRRKDVEIVKRKQKKTIDTELTMLDKTAGLTPFAKGFFGRMLQLGYDAGQIKAAMLQVAPQFGKQAADELYAGWEKLAGNPLMSMWQAGSKLAPKAMSMFRGAAPAAQKMLPGMEAAAAPSMMSRISGAMHPGLAAAGREAPMAHGAMGAMKDFGKSVFQSHPAQQMLPGMGHAAGTGTRMLGGAFTGQQMAGDPNSNFLTPWNWGARDWAGAVGGAAYGHRMPQMGAMGQAAGRRAFTGGMVGSMGDMTAGIAGVDTGGRLGQMGALGGFASPMVKGMRPGQMSPQMQHMAGGVKNLVNKPWEGAMNPMNVGRQMFGKGVPATQRAGAALGPGMMWGTAGLGAAGGALGAAKGMVSDWAGQGVAAKMQDPKFQDQMAMQITGLPAAELKSKVQQLSKLGDMGSLASLGSMFDPVIDMFMGQGAGAKMNPLQKLMLVLGGGAMVGGVMGGSGGMAGLGGLALAGGLMGGFPGLQGQGGPQANAQRPPAASPQASQGQPINEMGSSEPSSPPMMGNGGSGGPLGPQPRNELTVQQQAQAAPG